MATQFYCLNGGYTVEYSWDGSRFAPIGTAGAAAASSSSSSSTAATNAASMAPYGEVRGEELMWFFPADAAITHGAPFYSARATSFGYQTTHFGDERGGGVVSMRWESKERDVREQYLVFDPAASHGPAVHPNDHGGDRWELMGPFPHAVALFIALYTRANSMRTFPISLAIARRASLELTASSRCHHHAHTLSSVDGGHHCAKEEVLSSLRGLHGCRRQGRSGRVRRVRRSLRRRRLRVLLESTRLDRRPRVPQLLDEASTQHTSRECSTRVY